MRTQIYVDGFNLYHGALKKQVGCRWLNLYALAQSHLSPINHIVGIKFFTADIIPRPHHPDQRTRQNTYHRALQTLPNIEIFKGYFLVKTVSMCNATPPPRQVSVIKTEEKCSDVNLASQIIHDGHKGIFDCAVIVSGDSDFLMPLKILQNELRLPVGVLNPQKHPCQVLRKEATFYKHLRKNLILAAQFPDKLSDSQGVFHKPVGW